MDGRKLKATFDELISQYSRKAKAFRVSRRDVKGKPFGFIKKVMLFAFVQPGNEIFVPHRVVMNGNKYVGIHPVGTIGSLVQPGIPVQLRHHKGRGTETGA